MANQYGGRRTQVNYTIRSACSGLIGYIIWWPRNCSRLQYWQIDSCAAPGHHFSCHGNNLAGTPVRRRKWIETQWSWAHWVHPPLGRKIGRRFVWGFESFIAAEILLIRFGSTPKRNQRPIRCRAAVLLLSSDHPSSKLLEWFDWVLVDHRASGVATSKLNQSTVHEKDRKSV